ncbi:MAG: hypothetical protein KDK37_03025 [Leptospiraceae bacterium]|nr:hypothetical protein [Leptospiraceae bacterium]
MFLEAYETLHSHLGPSHWWPGETSFEVMVGAVLTQNTSWKNVEKALHRLSSEKAIRPEIMHKTPVGTLAQWIRSSGYFNQKARRLLALLDWYQNYDFRVETVRRRHPDSESVRRELLSISGIGPETADSILCYAFGYPVFVVDAYTHRWLERYDSGGHRAAAGNYHLLQSMVQSEFAHSFRAEELTRHFNEFHALIVRLSNLYCKKSSPLCRDCPLQRKCQNART